MWTPSPLGTKKAEQVVWRVGRGGEECYLRAKGRSFKEFFQRRPKGESIGFSSGLPWKPQRSESDYTDATWYEHRFLFLKANRGTFYLVINKIMVFYGFTFNSSYFSREKYIILLRQKNVDQVGTNADLPSCFLIHQAAILAITSHLLRRSSSFCSS